MVVHSCRPSPQEVETSGFKACLVYSELKVCHELHCEILSQKNLDMLSSCL